MDPSSFPSFLKPVAEQSYAVTKALSTDHAAKRRRVQFEFEQLYAEVMQREQHELKQLRQRKKLLAASFGFQQGAAAAEAAAEAAEAAAEAGAAGDGRAAGAAAGARSAAASSTGSRRGDSTSG